MRLLVMRLMEIQIPAVEYRYLRVWLNSLFVIIHVLIVVVTIKQIIENECMRALVSHLQCEMETMSSFANIKP